MKSHAKKILDHILNYTESERNSLDRFIDQGEYEPAILFDAQQAKLLRNRPALFWKLQNLRKFKGLDRDQNK